MKNKEKLLFKANDIVTPIRQIKNEMSGIAMIQVAESGENSIVIAAGANAYLDESLVEEQAENIRQADALLMQLETLLAAIC